MNMTYLGPWVWSFIPITVVMLAFCGSVLYVGADKFSRPSTDRLRREEAERLAEIEREKAPELV